MNNNMVNFKQLGICAYWLACALDALYRGNTERANRIMNRVLEVKDVRRDKRFWMLYDVVDAYIERESCAASPAEVEP